MGTQRTTGPARHLCEDNPYVLVGIGEHREVVEAGSWRD